MTSTAGRTAYTIDLTKAALARTEGIELKDASGWIVAEIRAARDGTFDHAGTILDTLNAAPGLVKALEFYADEKNWRRDSVLDMESGNFDGWGKARAALAAAKTGCA